MRRHFTASARLLTAMALAAGTLAFHPPVAGAAGPTCRVTNRNTRVVYWGRGGNLQTAIDAATYGDTLKIEGVCVGTYTIGQRLKLYGYATAADPSPTLDGNGAGTVLTVTAGEVAVGNLLITNGAAGPNGSGGGVYNAGVLRLAGSTEVSHNTAGFGAGIFNVNTLRLIDTSVVTQNAASINGGGIENDGVLHLNDQAKITANSAKVRGGGIYDAGSTTMNGTSSVKGNHANSGGGGVYIGEDGDFTMNDSTVISRNHATVGGGSGGGVLNNQGTFTMNDFTAISHNQAVFGAGIANFGISVTMTGASLIFENTASTHGGGIYNDPSSALNGAVDGGNVRLNAPDNIYFA